MIFSNIDNNLKANSIWRVVNKNLLNGEEVISYLSPGGYHFLNHEGKSLYFDFTNSEVSLGDGDKIPKDLIEVTQYGIDEDYTNSSLIENNYEKIEDFDIQFFKDNFKSVVEMNALIDIEDKNGKLFLDVDSNNYLECIFFEIMNYKTNEAFVMIDKR